VRFQSFKDSSRLVQPLPASPETLTSWNFGTGFSLPWLRASSYSDTTLQLKNSLSFGGTMKTKLSLMIAAALLALTAFSYGQAGTDVKKAADDTGKATKKAAVKTGDTTKTVAKDTGKTTEKAAAKTGDTTKTVAKDTGKDVKKGAEATGKTTEKAADKTGAATKTAAKDTGKGVAKGAKVVGKDVKKGAEKTEDVVK